jgi:hypothetical protein
VGKVRDAIVVLRMGANPPRLTGLVVEVPPRRRIFIPMTKVTAIDASQIIVTGAVNLRRFEKRSNETLVTAELLDRSLALKEDASTVTLLDVVVEQGRAKDCGGGGEYSVGAHHLRPGPALSLQLHLLQRGCSRPRGCRSLGDRLLVICHPRGYWSGWPERPHYLLPFR